MSISSKNIINKTWPVIIIVIFLANAGVSCTSRKAKLDRRNMIPEKELVKVLTDLYIADGLISHPHVNKWFPVLDSTSTYYHIIEEHGYTKETLDKTLKFYFYRNPRKLINIYDKVLGALSEMDSRAEKGVLSEQINSENIWPGKDYYPFPGMVDENRADFDILLNRIGTYTLTFTATVFPYDQSENPGMIAYTYTTDVAGNEVKTWLTPVKYIKDGNPHLYTVTVNIATVTNSHFAGNLRADEGNPESCEKHFLIASIKIGYTYSAL